MVHGSNRQFVELLQFLLTNLVKAGKPASEYNRTVRRRILLQSSDTTLIATWIKDGARSQIKSKKPGTLG
ncbi:hypothetical protein H6F96_15705 [Microcoleus sp. FACHB-53]|nr:hypothetical protein [Microcoleus sp. FACHB-53]